MANSLDIASPTPTRSKSLWQLAFVPSARWLPAAAGPAALILIWALVNATGLVTARLLPSPLLTGEALASGLWSDGLGWDLWETVRRTLEAFVIAAGAGVPLGIVIGSSVRVYRSIEFIIDFFRSTPATALFPLFMIIFGLGDGAKVAIAAFSALLIIVFNVAYGVMNARPTRMLASRVMGASRLRIFRDVTFFESLPQTFVGVRTAVSLALVIIVVAEMFIGSDNGLGRRIIDSQITFDMPGLYATILLAGALGYALNLFFLTLEARLVHWAGR